MKGGGSCPVSVQTRQERRGDTQELSEEKDSDWGGLLSFPSSLLIVGFPTFGSTQLRVTLSVSQRCSGCFFSRTRRPLEQSPAVVTSWSSACLCDSRRPSAAIQSLLTESCQLSVFFKLRVTCLTFVCGAGFWPVVLMNTVDWCGISSRNSTH